MFMKRELVENEVSPTVAVFGRLTVNESFRICDSQSIRDKFSFCPKKHDTSNVVHNNSEINM